MAVDQWKAINKQLTVVSLSDTVLNSAALSKIRDLGPIFIGIGRTAEGTAGAVT